MYMLDSPSVMTSPATQTGISFKTYQLFDFGIFHVIILVHLTTELVTETSGIKTPKNVIGCKNFCPCGAGVLV